jgi:cyclopropane fatty-acyl-phospholipid synthase-like methyltransferase
VTDDPAIAALIALHDGLPRQGPGDPAALDRMLDRLGVAPGGRAADLGCGSGATALRLAGRRGLDVLALDFAPPFIAALEARLATRPPSRGAVRPVVGVLAARPCAPGSLDLIVSEGAAYAIGFARALSLWRPLLRPGGAMVVSECVRFDATLAPDAAAFWAAAYPDMTDAAGTVARAEAAGLRLVAAERLDAAAWWESYYDPLAARCAALKPDADPALAAAIAETEAEMALFAASRGAWGYLLLALEAPA